MKRRWNAVSRLRASSALSTDVAMDILQGHDTVKKQTGTCIIDLLFRGLYVLICYVMPGACLVLRISVPSLTLRCSVYLINKRLELERTFLSPVVPSGGKTDSTVLKHTLWLILPNSRLLPWEMTDIRQKTTWVFS